MFVTARKAVRIRGDEDTVFDMPAGYIGDVPAWVENHWYYKALCKDGVIVPLVKPTDTELEAADKAAKAKEAEAIKAAEKKAKLDKAKADAKKQAEKLADEQGLDVAASKKLIAKMQKEAEEKE